MLTLGDFVDEAPDALLAVVDAIMRDGPACGALAAEWERNPGLDATAWEEVTIAGGRDALLHRGWHQTHLRGLDGLGVWLGAGHLARVEPAAMPPAVTQTPLGSHALRLSLSGAWRRAELGPIEDALAPILPSTAEAAAWERAAVVVVR